MKNNFIIATCVASLLITACAGPQNSPNQTGGMLVGGLAGGLLGAQFGKGTGALVGAGLGTLIGAYAGSEVGKSMDQKAAPPPPQYREDPRYARPVYGRPAYDGPAYVKPVYGYDQDPYYR